MDITRRLGQRIKASESSFFRPEQEEAIIRHRDELIRQGKLQRNTMPRLQPEVPVGIKYENTGDVLPEILGHQHALNSTKPNHVDKKFNFSKGYTVHQPSKSDIMKFASEYNRPSIYDGMMPGSAVSKAGREKWKASSLEGTSIFAVDKAQEFMLTEAAERSAQKRARLVNVGPKPVAPPVLKIAGIPLQVLPEPTAGRAMFWGTLLAVMAGSATASYVCKTLEIKSVDDVKPAMKGALNPMTEFFRFHGSGLREKVVTDEAMVDTTSLSFKLRETLR